MRQSGRDLVFWFCPETASIAELPMDDRETTLFVKGRSQDFQVVAVQGMLTWHVTDPELLASRIDFSFRTWCCPVHYGRLPWGWEPFPLRIIGQRPGSPWTCSSTAHCCERVEDRLRGE
ncbi:MAG TPA: hypothetical protein VF503_20485 [Sphingobium sp.]|uniref:hypothetical protein n=1 Tax=Sphingobium sp. TaxID=1912891 RepID=UPI002ED4B276